MDGFPALGLHGDKSQIERDWVLAEFKTAKHPIMIATDVAARGLGERGCRVDWVSYLVGGAVKCLVHGVQFWVLYFLIIYLTTKGNKSHACVKTS